jgi:DNA-binding transcriptional LysR family regulator
MLAQHKDADIIRKMNSDAFDIKQLEAFAAVISSGSITGAARLLGRSQPAVTRLIQDLEANVGFPLLHRNGPRISPTPQGLAFHEEVERLLVGFRHMRERADAIGAAELRAIEIAATPALATGITAQALARVEPALLPRVMHVQSVAAEQVIQLVQAHSADLGIATLPIEHPGVDVLWIGEAPCVAAVPADDALAQRPVIRMADLAGRRLITMANPYRLRRRVDEALARAGVSPASLIDTNSALTALGAARAGLGVALIEPASAYGLPLEGVAVRPLDVAIPFLFGAIVPAARPLTPTLEALSLALQDMAAALLPDFRLHDAAGREALAAAIYGADTGASAAVSESTP